MIVSRVITCLIFLFLFSLFKVKCNSLDLGNAVKLSWDLTKGEGEVSSLTIRIALPTTFRWLVVGFDNTQTEKISYEDLALVTIEQDGAQQISYLKTVDLDEAYKLIDSHHELYDWGEHGRKKSRGTYYFKLERPVQYLKTCEPINLVWAYGVDLWGDEAAGVLRDRFHFRTIVLDSYKQFPCSHSYSSLDNENLENENAAKPDVNYNGKVKSLLHSDKNKGASTVGNPSEFPQPTTAVKFTTESESGTSDTTKVVNSITDAIHTALINQKNETKLDAVQLSTELKQDGILKVTTEQIIPSTKSTPTLLAKNQTIKPTSVSTSAIVLDNITASKSNSEVVTSEEINHINKNPQYVNQSFIKEAIKTTAKGNDKNFSSCHLNPCLHNRCPINTKCIANLLYCTSSCENNNNNGTSNKDTTSHCICVSGSHWYDFFKDNENSVYFAVIGLSAFFTGMIVLCLACCCGHKAKMKNMRKSKVSFYKVDDFESSADEEVEFLAEGKKPFVD